MHKSKQRKSPPTKNPSLVPAKEETNKTLLKINQTLKI